jgi:hypothetical protein
MAMASSAKWKWWLIIMANNHNDIVSWKWR